MQLDATELDILLRIGNLREMLSQRGSLALGTGRSMRAVMSRRLELQREIETLTTRFLNLGLKAARLPHAIDPETKPLPVCEQRHPRQFAGPVWHHY